MIDLKRIGSGQKLIKSVELHDCSKVKQLTTKQQLETHKQKKNLKFPPLKPSN
jgi:hypothetical protein